MNESGPAVKRLLTTYNLSPYGGSPAGRQPTNLLVVHDEIDLPFGQMRLSHSGAAGHKGVESIINSVGNGYARLRIGIENRKEYRVPPTDDYVLQNFTKEEQTRLKKVIIPEAISKIQQWILNSKSQITNHK